MFILLTELSPILFVIFFLFIFVFNCFICLCVTLNSFTFIVALFFVCNFTFVVVSDQMEFEAAQKNEAAQMNGSFTYNPLCFQYIGLCKLCFYCTD